MLEHETSFCKKLLSTNASSALFRTKVVIIETISIIYFSTQKRTWFV